VATRLRTVLQDRSRNPQSRTCAKLVGSELIKRGGVMTLMKLLVNLVVGPLQFRMEVTYT
jgi:hypothetical protein